MGVLAAVAVLALLAPTAGAAAAAKGPTTEERECPRTIGSGAPGPALTKKVAFQSSGPAEPINMGGLRGIGKTDLVVSASPPLPSSVKSSQITLDVPKRFSRAGAVLNSTFLPAPRFTNPRIIEHGRLVAFTMCVEAGQINAGSYVGQVIVGGPENVEAATVAVTVNAKDGEDFEFGLIVAGLLAAAALLLRSVKAHLDKQLAASRSVRKAFGEAFRDFFGFWVATAIGVGAAIVAILQVYDGNVAWGADPTASLLALAGTAISAAGVGTFIASLK